MEEQHQARIRLPEAANTAENKICCDWIITPRLLVVEPNKSGVPRPQEEGPLKLVKAALRVGSLASTTQPATAFENTRRAKGGLARALSHRLGLV